MSPSKDGISSLTAPLGGLSTLEKKKKGGEHKRATAAKLDGLIVDLDRRAQLPVDAQGRLADGTSCLEAVRHLHKLMAQVQKLEKQLIPALAQPPATKSVEERLAVFEEWLRANNVEMEGLKLKGGLPEGCGVIATKEFKQAEMMCVIPSDLFMTTATAINSRADVGILFRVDRLFQSLQNLNLVMHLLFEKHKPESQWTGYIASLPGQGSEGEPMSPLAYSMEALEALEGTLALRDVHMALRHFIRQYAHVRLVLRHCARFAPELARALTWFSLSEFRWATMTVTARQNDIPHMPNDFPQWEMTLALIPLMDLFNHEGGEWSAVIDIPSGRLELSAKREFKAGDQVYISYGSRDNSKLFLFQGFVYENNEYDKIKLPVELSKTDPLYSKKAALLRFLQLPQAAHLDVSLDGRPSPELSLWLQVVAMIDDEAVTAALRERIAFNTEQLRQITAMAEANAKKAEPEAGTAQEAGADSAEKEQGTRQGSSEAKEKGKGEEQGGQKVGESAEGQVAENGEVKESEGEVSAEQVSAEDELFLQPLPPVAGELLASLCQEWIANHAPEEVKAVTAEEVAAGDSGGEANGALKAVVTNAFDPLSKSSKNATKLGKDGEEKVKVQRDREIQVSNALRTSELRILLRAAEYGKHCSQVPVEGQSQGAEQGNSAKET